MSKAANPLLIAIRSAFPKLKTCPGGRIYTTAYKAGGYRVKLYGFLDSVPGLLKLELRRQGWQDVSVKRIVADSHFCVPSLVIKASGQKGS